MWIRCTSCSSLSNFSNTRGSKISNCKCKCGGGFEKLTIVDVDGEHPTNPEFTFTHVGGPKDGQKYHSAGKNKNSDLFDLDRAKRKAIPLTQPPL